jgi:hypothetical protein
VAVQNEKSQEREVDESAQDMELQGATYFHPLFSSNGQRLTSQL